MTSCRCVSSARSGSGTGSRPPPPRAASGRATCWRSWSPVADGRSRRRSSSTWSGATPRPHSRPPPCTPWSRACAASSATGWCAPPTPGTSCPSTWASTRSGSPPWRPRVSEGDEEIGRCREAVALWSGGTAYAGVRDDLVMAERVRLEELLRRVRGDLAAGAARARRPAGRRRGGDGHRRRAGDRAPARRGGGRARHAGGGPAAAPGGGAGGLRAAEGPAARGARGRPGPGRRRGARAHPRPGLGDCRVAGARRPAGGSTPDFACRSRRHRRSVARPRWQPCSRPWPTAGGWSRSPARAAWASPGCSPTSARRSRPTTTSCTSRCPGTRRETPRTWPRRWPSPRGCRSPRTTAWRAWSGPCRPATWSCWSTRPSGCSDPRPS